MAMRSLGLLLPVFAALGIGCGVTDPAPPEVVEIRLEPAAASLVTGEARQLTATLLDRSGNVLTARAISWVTTSPTVATVSRTGWVTAVTAGQAVITASVNTTTASAVITVAPRAASVEVTPGQATLDVSDKIQLKAMVRDASGTSLHSWPVRWTSSDPAIVQISADGLVTPVSPGTANVSAVSEESVGNATVVVVRLPVEAVSISPSPVSLFRSGTFQLTPTVVGAGGKVLEGRAIVWSSSDPVVASVNQSGLVSANAAGAATIAATVEGHTGNAMLSVVEMSFASVAAGGDHTCSLSPSLSSIGAPVCWGNNASGQVGGLSSESCGNGWYGPYECRMTPAVLGGVVGFTELAAGGAHTCGLSLGGQAYCWGDGSVGTLGDGRTILRSAPVAVVGGLSFQSLTAGAVHTCGLTVLGAAYCWGKNDQSQLGDGTATSRATPVAVAGGLSFARLSAGDAHTCGITTEAKLYCWGSNLFGQLGDGSLAQRVAPVAVAGNLSVIAVDAGGIHTCAIITSGEAYCWGANHEGELGDGTVVSSPSPVAVAGGTKWKTITAGGNFTCGIASNDLTHCWGYNYSGQLGTGSTQNRRTPSQVIGGLVFESLSAGAAHVCGRTTSGRLYCWGGGWSGQLGTGGTSDRSEPVLVIGQP